MFSPAAALLLGMGCMWFVVPFFLVHVAGRAACCLRRTSAALVIALATFAASPAVEADTLDWNTRPATNLRTGATDALTYGTAPAQITVTTSGSTSGAFDGAGPNILAIEPTSTSNGTTGYVNTFMNASVDDESVFQTTTISFTEPVYNVSVIVGDIDGGPTFSLSGAAFNDIVEFRAVNAATGATILPTSGTPATALVTWNAATGRALSTNTNITNGNGNVTVTFAGPIRSFTIRHIAGANSTVTNPTAQFVFIETVTYTRSPLLTVQKTSLNGTGTFTFDRSNSLNTGTTPWSGTTTSTSVTTTVAGTPVTGSPGILFATSTATTLTETGPSGWDITSSPVTCTDSNSAVSGNPASFSATVSGLVVTVAATNIRAGANITCAITNNRRPILTLVKTVTNDNGGTEVVAAWTLTATGPTTISGASGTAAVTSQPVAPGDYALSETGPAGYAAGAWSCTAGTLVGSNLTLAYGQTATCSINNNDISPVLTLVKTVTNDNGGTQVVAAWTLTATGPTTISGASGTAAVTSANVNAGVYALSESGPAGYAASAWSCTAGSLSGSNLTLTPGTTATCTINNNDISPVLTLVKTVTNDNGGTEVAGAWTLTATGPTTISGASGTAAVTNANVNAGVYALSETGPAGYAASAWSCTAGTLVGTNLTLALGETSTCTINNNDIAATLTLVKVIDGDVTPSAVPGFTLTATGPTTISGVTGAVAVTNASVSAGAYTLSESGPAGYVFDGWSCTAGTLVGTSLSLPLATTATCTVTNYRIPTFAVQKITTGGFGGPFSFTDSGVVGSFSDITTTSAGVAQPASPTPLFAAFGTPVTITESMSLAWIAGGVTCSDANAANTGNSNPVATSSTESVSIPAAANRKGAIITCVFTNAAAAPALSMTKTPDVASVNAAGQTVNYAILVSNSGNTTLGPITVADALGAVTCPSSGGSTVTLLAAGGSETCSLSYTVPQAVLDSNGGGDGDIDNTASATATYNGSPVNGGASATVALVITPALVIDKSASTGGPVNANDVYTYTFRVRNTGNVTITGVVVNDTFNGYGVAPVPGSEVMFADAAPLGDSSDGAANGSWDSLAPGDEIAFTASYTVVQGDIDNP
jgi:uncharacterized repeat protein (TIGR01451 family)